MALKKTKHPTAIKDIQSKKSNIETEAPKEIKQIWLEDYLSLKDFKFHPATQNFFNRLAQEFMDWADKPTSLVLVEFYCNQKIPTLTFHDWFDKYPVMKQAHTYAKHKVSARKEEGAIIRKYDGSFVKESLTKHDDDWREYMKFKADVAKLIAGNEKIEVIVECKKKHKEGESCEDKV